ncbi:MAG: C25 family cysteine peptidase [Anaerolineales bacterium]
MRIIKKFLILLLLLAAACNFPGGKPSAAGPSTTGSTALPPAPTETVAPSATSTPDDLSSPAGETYELLIVTPRAFLDSMRRLAEWKSSSGMPAGILVLEDVDRLCEGRDAPERIKRCLALYNRKSGVRYAMLAGDGDQFPIRWTMADIVGPTVGNTAFYPADLYYADLYKADGSFDDWDSNANGYFGEIGGEIRSGLLNIDNVDLNPDIAVGRAPVSTAEEASIYVEKVISYETLASNSEWARRVLAISSGGYLPDDCRREEEMLALLPAEWNITRLYYEGNPCQETPALSAEAIVDALNGGVGLVSFLGHGNMDLWADAVTVKDFANVQNAKQLPVVFSGGCGTATFTAYPPGGPYSDINGVHHAGGEFGEAFTGTPPPPAPIQAADNLDGMMEFSLVQTPNGVVVYVGAVTGAQFPAMFDVNRLFFEGIVHAGPRAGDAWNYAIRKYYQIHTFETEYNHADWYILAVFHQMWKFMLFGDPSLRIGGVPALL